MTGLILSDAESATLAAYHDAMAWTHQVVLGKSTAVQLAYVCLLAQGHLLLDDLPGVGKTTLARTLAWATGLGFHRVQFTSDLLPSDILGTSVFNSATQRFEFHPGPVFTPLLLADEINRASGRTQSALLEAMAEQQVSVDGVTHALPRPFFVIATQNPVDMTGTFPLPDSQLDRFLFRLALGYPDAESEMQLLRQDGVRHSGPPPAHLTDALGPEALQLLQGVTERVHVSDAVLSYAFGLIQATRAHADIDVGLSPRAGLALLRAARSLALLQGRTYVIPEDLQTVFGPVAGHRLGLRHDGSAREREVLVTQLMQQVHAP